MNDRDYVRETVERNCSGSGKNLDLLIEDLRKLDEASEGNAATLLLAGLGLAGEAGEVTDLIKKLVFHGKPFTEEIRDKLIKELGDVMWYSGALCMALNTGLGEVKTLNHNKLMQRFPKGFTPEAAEARVDVLQPNTRLEDGNLNGA